MYAVVYHHGKTIYLGAYGSPESKIAYARFIAEQKQQPEIALPTISKGESILREEPGATVNELGIAFLDHVLKIPFWPTIVDVRDILTTPLLSRRDR